MGDLHRLGASPPARVIVATERFADTARLCAAALGEEGIEVLTVPHPVAGTGIANLRRIAADVVATLAAPEVVG